MNPVYQRRTDEEIFREEGIERSLEFTKDLKKDVTIAFNDRLKKMRLQNNSLNLLTKSDAAARMNDEMGIPSPTFLSSLLWTTSKMRKTIPELYLKTMQTFFNPELSPGIREQLTTLFPVDKEKLKIVDVRPIPSLVKDIKKIFEDFRYLKPEAPQYKISREMGLPNTALSNILEDDPFLLKNSFIKRDQIEKIRSFAQKNLKNVENEYPILFSEKLLEIDNGILSVSSEALHSAPLIQPPVISNNASETPSNKRQKVNETPFISFETSSIPLQISQKNDNITTESSSVFTPQIDDSMRVEIAQNWRERIPELEHLKLFENLWET